MSDVWYTEEHEWIRKDGDDMVVGITEYAAVSLGDVVFVDLPEEGSQGEMGEDCAVVESVKAASDIYWPISGTVTAINSNLDADPSLANSDPMGDGWFFKISATDLSQLDGLMSKEEYEKFIE